MVFQNQANNPILGDINEDTDVFLRDRETGLTELISVNNFGTGPGNDGSFSPSVSANGRFVVFRSRASDLTIGGNDGAGLQIFLRDRATSTTRLISLNSANTAPSQGNDNIFPSDISADGRFVVLSFFRAMLSIWIHSTREHLPMSFCETWSTKPLSC